MINSTLAPLHTVLDRHGRFVAYRAKVHERLKLSGKESSGALFLF